MNSNSLYSTSQVKSEISTKDNRSYSNTSNDSLVKNSRILKVEKIPIKNVSLKKLYNFFSMYGTILKIK